MSTASFIENDRFRADKFSGSSVAEWQKFGVGSAPAFVAVAFVAAVLAVSVAAFLGVLAVDQTLVHLLGGGTIAAAPSPAVALALPAVAVATATFVAVAAVTTTRVAALRVHVARNVSGCSNCGRRRSTRHRTVDLHPEWVAVALS